MISIDHQNPTYIVWKTSFAFASFSLLWFHNLSWKWKCSKILIFLVFFVKSKMTKNPLIFYIYSTFYFDCALVFMNWLSCTFSVFPDTSTLKLPAWRAIVNCVRALTILGCKPSTFFGSRSWDSFPYVAKRSPTICFIIESGPSRIFKPTKDNILI